MRGTPVPRHSPSLGKVAAISGQTKMEDVKPLRLNDLEHAERHDMSSEELGGPALFRRTPAKPASGYKTGHGLRYAEPVPTLPPRKLPAAAAHAEATDLLQILVFRKALTREQAERVPRHARASRVAVVSTIIKLGLASEVQIADALAAFAGSVSSRSTRSSSMSTL